MEMISFQSPTHDDSANNYTICYVTLLLSEGWGIDIEYHLSTILF
jgi:hypothetical protein